MARQISLLGGFRVEIEGAVFELPYLCQRLTAFVAMHSHSVTRSSLSVALWPDDPLSEARPRIRWGLWRLRQIDTDIVVQTGSSLALAPDVTVDHHEAICIARTLLENGNGGGVAAASAAADADDARSSGGRDPFAHDLLPDWDEDWVAVERERFRQLRLHVLETRCLRLTARGALALAVDAGIEAVAAEPFRESAHRALIEVYLREGNGGDALRQFERYREIASDLGLVPSQRLVQMVGTARGVNRTNGSSAQMNGRQR